MSDAASLIPEITDEDIDWVRELMQLTVLDGPRRAFLTSRNTLDVSACPGSGKTTLIVAKLAILARKWPHHQKGICVLSHTNVAREEIQRRLGNSVVGQRLLMYPHFIDTIHGFVNRFLALPWLHSNGYPSPTIDNDVTTACRRGALGKDYWTVQSFLSQKRSDFDRLRICARDLSFDLGGRAFPAGPNAKSFKLAKQAIEKAAKAGYFCFDEMFVWARALVEDFPSVTCWLRRRFPLVIIDEMQDTFELQGAMLHMLFPRTATDVVMQRVGDPNQAIFDNSEAMPYIIDPFPDSDILRHLQIPNSHRFGPEIAALASPFAFTPVSASGLCGIGPKTLSGAPANTCHHAIFVFPDSSTTGVLDVYGKHVLGTFDDNALASGVVTAVGAVHKDEPDIEAGHAHFPKSVPHYWKGYTAAIARKESHPKYLVQYIQAAQAAVRDVHDLSPGVEKVASGFIRLADLVGNAGLLKRKARTHGIIVEALTANTTALAAYRRLLKALLIDMIPLTQAKWRQVQDDVVAVACALCEGTTERANGMEFAAWSADALFLEHGASSSPNDSGGNVYCVEDRGRRVDIRLGSIHSIKGQTHLATMVLDTYSYARFSKRMLPWLLGAKANESGADKQDRKRLLQIYVAMTRPTHLICLAIPRSVLGNDDGEMSKHVATLKGRGWSVGEIVDSAFNWY